MSIGAAILCLLIVFSSSAWSGGDLLDIAPSCWMKNDGMVWRIVVTGNSGYEQDLRVWWHHCHRVGLCENNDNCRRNEVVFYAEDPAIYQKYQASQNLIVKRGWEVETKFANHSLVGSEERFSYDGNKPFFHMMSRRPAILLRELKEVEQLEHQDRLSGFSTPRGVLFSDLDVFFLKDPRPYFVDEKNSTRIDLWGANARSSNTGPYNAGFLAIRTSLIPVVEAWKELLENRHKPSPNQISFNNILKREAPKRNLNHRLLPKKEFPVGKIFQWTNAELVLSPSVVVFHNNWCSDSCNKTKRAMDLGIWIPATYDEIMGLS